MVSRLVVIGVILLAAAPSMSLAQELVEPKETAKPAVQVDLRLTLPQQVYAVAGIETSIYFDNIGLTQDPQNYRFDVDCELGRVLKRRWVIKPTSDQTGEHTLTISVSDLDGTEIGQASTQLYVSAADAGGNRNLRLLIVGDSLTHASIYPNELARLLSQPGNPDWTMLGTHQPKGAAEGVRHEGYGGWTWQRFVEKYEPNPDGTHRKRSSPFLFLNSAGKPKLDIALYLDQFADGQSPNIAFFLLGINDCFSADPEDLDAIDARIDRMFGYAQTLLLAFHEAAPNTELAICVTTPPNARESGFEANYKGRYHRWGWKRIQHRIVERLLSEFGEQQDDDALRGATIHLVPTHLNLDPIDGYPENNGVHPNALGYKQIGASLYAWLKWRMSENTFTR